jgi:putative beta-lysine N-acetyltransferase
VRASLIVTTQITIGKSSLTVYTDAFNKRIRIDDYRGDLKEVLNEIYQQTPTWTEKLIVKARTQDVPFFIAHGFACEAFIKGYFAGEDMFFVTRYFSADRERREKWELEQSIIERLVSEPCLVITPSREGVKLATPTQAGLLANLYRDVFKIYPTPLQEESHVLKTMNEGTLYAFIESGGRIVSAASAEVNATYGNAELTDCATLPESEGQGHMKKLLSFLEQKLRENRITCCYTIARSESYSMNKAFAQLGYTYGGRLIKNCYIYSGLEDMNVWYKQSV